MNPIALLQATVPKNHTAHNVDMAKGLESEGSFFNILGHMLTRDINTEELQMEAEQHMDVIRILALFNDITEDGFDYSSFAGEEGIEELLAVLPEKWQAHLLEILAENELTEEQFTSFPIIEQLIVLLVMMEFSEDGIETTSGKKNESWNELKQLLSKHMPQLSVTATADQLRNRQGNETSLLQHVITHIEETVSRSDKQHPKTFVQALADRKKPTMTLPSLPHVTTNVSSSNTTTSFGHEFNQMMTRAEQATIHLGEHLPKEVQEKQFIRQFQTILQRGVFLQTPQGLNTFSIKLFPEHLGRLDIQFSQMNGEI